MISAYAESALARQAAEQIAQRAQPLEGQDNHGPSSANGQYAKVKQCGHSSLLCTVLQVGSGYPFN